MARSGGYPCARIPIFGWSDRNFRCIIYSRFNEPRKRSKGPRGLFLIIRRTREGRVSRSPFPPLPSFLLRTSSPPPPSFSPPSPALPMLHGFLSFFVVAISSFPATSSSIDEDFIAGLLVQFFSSRVSFAFFSPGEEKREDWYVWYKSYTGMVRQVFRERCRKDLTDGRVILNFDGVVD